MDRETLAGFERELRRQRRVLTHQVDEAQKVLATPRVDEVMEEEDQAQHDADALVQARFEREGKREIEEIDSALERLADGTYGVCTICGEGIAVARLRALPAASCCVECAGRREHSSPPRPNLKAI